MEYNRNQFLGKTKKSSGKQNNAQKSKLIYLNKTVVPHLPVFVHCALHTVSTNPKNRETPSEICHR